MCGGDPYSLIVVRINLFVFSTCVEVILECDRPDYQGDSILHVCGGDPEHVMESCILNISILHVCGGDPLAHLKVNRLPLYSPRVWR